MTAINDELAKQCHAGGQTEYCRPLRRCVACRDDWAERAAIIEFDHADQSLRPSRAEAEQLAREQLRARVRRGEQGRLAV